MVEFAVLQHQRPGRRAKVRHVFAFGPFCHTNAHTIGYIKSYTNFAPLSPLTTSYHPPPKPYLQGTATLRSQPTTPYTHKCTRLYPRSTVLAVQFWLVVLYSTSTIRVSLRVSHMWTTLTSLEPAGIGSILTSNQLVILERSTREDESGYGASALDREKKWTAAPFWRACLFWSLLHREVGEGETVAHTRTIDGRFRSSQKGNSARSTESRRRYWCQSTAYRLNRC
jgi:hypothetical protein